MDLDCQGSLSNTTVSQHHQFVEGHFPGHGERTGKGEDLSIKGVSRRGGLFASNVSRSQSFAPRCPAQLVAEKISLLFECNSGCRANAWCLVRVRVVGSTPQLPGEQKLATFGPPRNEARQQQTRADAKGCVKYLGTDLEFEDNCYFEKNKLSGDVGAEAAFTQQQQQQQILLFWGMHMHKRPTE